MIESVKPIVTYASCDACASPLEFNVTDVEHGRIVNDFGYDTPELDQLGADVGARREVHLCQACYTKACVAVGLDPCSLARVGAPT